MTYKVLATVNHKSLDKKNIKQFKSGALAVAVEKASNGNDFVKNIKSTFFSSTKNQVIAFIVSTISCFIMVMAGFGFVLASVRSWAPLWFTEVIQSFSFLSHFKRIQYGVLDLTTFIFFISMIMICISINIFLVQLKKAD